MKKLLFLLIFIEGFLVMGIELASTVILKPYFGGSLEVWTFVLGITTCSLAMGYLFGTWLSKRKHTLQTVYFLFFALALSIYLMPFTSKFLFRSFFDVGITARLAISIPPFLFPPLFLLGSISTLVVKLFNENGETAGSSASKTYAISTIAGVLALFSVAFVFITYLSTLQLIYLLFVIALIGATAIRWKHAEMKLFLPLILFFSFLSTIYFTKGAEKIQDIFPGKVEVLYSSDGLIGQITVLKDFTSRTKTLLVNNTVQSTTDFYNFGNYVHVKDISNFIRQTQKKGRILIAGLGAGNLVHELSKDNQYIDVLEIDRRMLEVCRDHFYLPQGKNINYFIDDARHFINTKQKTYDIIILDLSIGESIPSNVYTKEAFAKLHHMLNKDGMLFLNFFSKDNQQGLKAAYSIGKTLEAAKFQVRLLNKEVDTSNQSAFVFYADKHLPLNATIDSLSTQKNFHQGIVLSDKNSKLDLIHKRIILDQREDYIFNYSKYFSELKP